jgi:hypothetical protein
MSDVNAKREELKQQLAKEVLIYHKRIGSLNIMEEEFGYLDEKIGLDEKEREIAENSRKNNKKGPQDIR